MRAVRPAPDRCVVCAWAWTRAAQQTLEHVARDTSIRHENHDSMHLMSTREDNSQMPSSDPSWPPCQRDYPTRPSASNPAATRHAHPPRRGPPHYMRF